ncbi:receptor-like protein EIX1 [Syzygium oleosum]|uniref:receptor-like protein EIX1 n=1 Tax=Syzygium oleosum TaxID=219896 RepID=UPI0011D24358|nr:receptor-like protein EIX1 [Syzygium oleosum]
MARHDSVKMLVLVSLLLILDNACVCLCKNRSSSSICFEEERDALIQFRQNLSDTSHLLSPWNGEDCCRWTGVKCDQVNGHVVMLQITSGTDFPVISFTASDLNSSLLNLRYLSYLELSGIYFENAHTLKFIGSMKQLRYLNFSSSFGFSIPREWGNLTKLEVLDLHTYYNMGVVEDILWVSHLQALKYLDMSGLNITGSRDQMQVISKLPSLLHLSLSNCGIYEVHLPTSLHLQYLDLSDNFFRRLILSTIFQNMTSLRHLDFSGTSFKGPIPSTIFQNMTSLRHLDLSWSSFEGPIPITIFQNVTSLRHLDLSGNSFKGPIPSTIFQNMISLKHLDLSWNFFNSSVPRCFDNLRSLVDLDLTHNLLQSIEGGLFSLLRNQPFLRSLLLGHNELHEEIFSVEGNSSGRIGKNLERLEIYNNFLGGALPNWLGHLKNLTVLDLSHNQLTGDIPEALGRLQVLLSLDLSNNLLNGTIPHSLGQLQDLHYLDLSANSLRGTLSEIHFSNLSKLSYLNISKNYLAFEVDSNWIPPFNLWYIGMTSCEFGTEFPRWIRTQVKATKIDLSNASITGTLPDWLGLMSFNFLDLSYNQINGTLPKFPTELYLLDLSHNFISGTIPQDIGLAMPNLESLYLNDNLLSGPIPTSLCEMELEVLHLGRNELVGKIPACWKENFMSLLDLSSNKLSGVIPSSLGNLFGLGSLHLNNNSLHGEIPVTMKNCTSLLILDLGENKISGSVPHWLGRSFQFLQILRLRDNMFNGSIPPQLCFLSALQILDLAMNNLTGIIPNCLGYMNGMKLNKSIDDGNLVSPPAPSALVVSPAAAVLSPMSPTDWTQEHVKQVTKGIDLDYTTLVLQLMVNLDLSSNKLTGPIPEELTLLSKLRGLNLSGNFLSGGIPSRIGYMISLESLDLSNNHLSGTIPQSFSVFTSLSKLNLSHNNFTGPIPKGNQIQTLVDPSIYADNPLLCGDPLLKKCPVTEAPQAPEEDTDEESKIQKVMFCVVIMLGFATGFWGVIGVLVYKKNWRRVYFDYVDRKTDMVYVIVVVKAAELRRRLRRA